MVGRDSVEPRLINPRRQQQIRANPFPLDVAKLERLRQTFCAFAGDCFARIASAQNFRRIKKRHALRQTTKQKRRIHLAAAFDQQTGDIFRAQLFQQPSQVQF